MAKITGIRRTARRTRPKAPCPGRVPVAKAKNSRKNGAPEFDAFAKAYLDTAVWANRPEDCDVNVVWPGCHPAILEDCLRFQRENRELLELAYALTRLDGRGRRPYDVTDAGHDFALSRNRHAAGFWDRELGIVGDKLDKAAKAYRSVDVVPGRRRRKYWLFIG